MNKDTGTGNILSKKFIAKIRKRRQELGMSQLKLAQKIGYINNNINMWERVNVGVFFKKFPELEKALGIKLEVLWNGEKI